MQTKLLFVATKLHLISWNKHILFLSSGLNLHAHFLFHVKGLLQFPTTLKKQYECEPGVCHSAYWMGTCKTLHICYIFLLSQPHHTDLHLSHYGMVVIIPVFQELLVLLSVIVVYGFFSFSFPLSVIGADAGNGIRVFIPDIGMFVAGLVIWLLCRSLVQKRPPEDMAQYNADFEAEEQVSLFSSLTVFQRCLCHTQGLFAFLTRFNYLSCSSRFILRNLTDYMICETIVSVHSFCTLLTVPKMTDICKKQKT